MSTKPTAEQLKTDKADKTDKAHKDHLARLQKINAGGSYVDDGKDITPAKPTKGA